MSKRQEKTFSRRRFIAHVGTVGAFLARMRLRSALAQEESSRVQRPNIILLVTDDQRWDAMGCMGNPIVRTPHMDRLASEGVLFTNNFCTTSICATSRASIFTGMYARRHGINSFGQPLSETAFAQSYPGLLREAGYRTGFIGKYGLGGPLPEDKFDYFKGYRGQGKYFNVIDGKTVHLTRILTEQALEFLRGCSEKQPFCLSISFKAPHVQDADPRQFLYDPAFEELYEGVKIPFPETGDERYFEALPEFIRESEGRRRWKRRFSTPEQFQCSVKGYYRLITGVDVAVGKIMKALDDAGFIDNTAVVLTADNGFFLGEHGLAGKWLMYEESIRTPLVIRYLRLPSSVQRSRREEMTLNIDIAPTLLDMAGVRIPPAVQGNSLLPLVKGEAPTWRSDWFYEHLFNHKRIPKSEGVRTRRWKYITYVDRHPPYEELYNLARDPHEKRNVAAVGENKEILNVLRKRWRAFRESLV